MKRLLMLGNHSLSLHQVRKYGLQKRPYIYQSKLAFLLKHPYAYMNKKPKHTLKIVSFMNQYFEWGPLGPIGKY